MKSLWTMLLCVLILTSTALGENREVERAAIESANHWLSLVDEGDYAISWNEAAPIFKVAVSKDQWVNMLQGSRSPLGRVISRGVKTALHKTSLPGAPDG